MRKLDPAAALVLFSGGQDSSIALAWALSRYARVETLVLDYGQRHAVELTTRLRMIEALRALRPDWSEKLGRDHPLDLKALGAISDTALTRQTAIATGTDGLPTTFVPGRNLIFLTMAGAIAYGRGIGLLVGGMCETDFSGYPDCRQATLDAQMTALRLGMDCDLALETPLMALSKAESWRFAETIGGVALVDLIVEHSHSCYLGERRARHDWGYGCGACPACHLRAGGWRDYAEGAA
ncbi:MAG: 7-cyano-7-deazaguanine synthase QueC [Parvularculaceae bacterium]|nr:7-cyano-7-deazaguanine synthase QueC [Parvularculaceae bacterium]